MESLCDISQKRYLFEIISSNTANKKKTNLLVMKVMVEVNIKGKYLICVLAEAHLGMDQKSNIDSLVVTPLVQGCAFVLTSIDSHVFEFPGCVPQERTHQIGIT